MKGSGQHAAPSTEVSCFSAQMQSCHDCPTETGIDISGCPTAVESGCISRFRPQDIPADCYFMKHTESLEVLASEHSDYMRPQKPYLTCPQGRAGKGCGVYALSCTCVVSLSSALSLCIDFVPCRYYMNLK